MPASEPRQQRSRQTLDRILDAAVQLFAERGEAGFTFPAIAARAGVSIGTLYRRFESKEDLLKAMFDRLRAQDRNAAISVWSTTDWAAMPVRAMTDRLVSDLSRVWREQAPFMRATVLRHLTMAQDEAFEHGIARMSESMREFTVAVRTCGRRVEHSEVDLACQFAYRMIISMASRRTIEAIEMQSPSDVSWDQLQEQMSEAVARYLFGSDHHEL